MTVTESCKRWFRQCCIKSSSKKVVPARNVNNFEKKSLAELQQQIRKVSRQANQKLCCINLRNKKKKELFQIAKIYFEKQSKNSISDVNTLLNTLLAGKDSKDAVLGANKRYNKFLDNQHAGEEHFKVNIGELYEALYILNKAKRCGFHFFRQSVTSWFSC